MSWSESFSQVTCDDLSDVQPQNAATASTPASLEQFTAARDGACALILSGAVGDQATHKFFVNLSGHANQGHAPAEGFANDAVTISVYQAAAEV